MINKRGKENNSKAREKNSASPLRRKLGRLRALRARYVPVWALCGIVAALLSAAVYILCRTSTRLADFFVSTVGFALRSFMSFVTAVLPFSLFELLCIFALPLTVLIILLALRRMRGRREAIRAAFSLVAVVGIIYSGYVFALGIGYMVPPLAERAGVEDARDITESELYDTFVTVRDEINALVGEIDYSGGDGGMHMSMDELSLHLSDRYSIMAEQYGFFVNFHSRVKPVMLSPIMSDMHLGGIYTFFTGEANVNVEYPDYDTVYTSAHEMAHQRGIIRENEANFMAFLICIGSENAFVRYSGYMRMLEYLSSALYSLDAERYYEAMSHLDERARGDIEASAAVARAHRDSPLGKFVSRLNDGYLKLNGTDGSVSYGYVVRLAVGYYQRGNDRSRTPC